MREAHVELIGLHKRFGAVAAVSDVNLTVPEGKVTTLLGPSGCGKTTLLRLIAGFIQPDKGEIRIKDRRVNEIPPQRRSTVVVFQDYALFPHLDVFENVAYGLKRRRIKNDDIRRRVADMLAFLGLAGQERASPLQLSGGQQQRVALARALVVEPDVLLLDEPLSNLDVKLRVRVRTELREIQRSLGKTTILVTHDQEEALSISDRIAVLDAGQIRQVGSPHEVYSRPADRFVADFVGIANFVPGMVQSAGQNETIVDCPLGQVRVEGGNWRAAQAVTLVLRPTALLLAPSAGEGQVPVTVISSSFLGEIRRYVLQVGDRRLIADQLSSEPVSETNLWLGVDTKAGCHLLPESAA